MGDPGFDCFVKMGVYKQLFARYNKVTKNCEPLRTGQDIRKGGARIPKEVACFQGTGLSVQLSAWEKGRKLFLYLYLCRKQTNDTVI